MLDVRQWTHSDWPFSTAALGMLPELVASSAHQDGTSTQAQIANVGDKTLGMPSAMASDRRVQAGAGDSERRSCSFSVPSSRVPTSPGVSTTPPTSGGPGDPTLTLFD